MRNETNYYYVDLLIVSEKHLEILDLSGQKLTKLAKAQHEELEITTLILDENDLQKLDHIDSFPKLQKVYKNDLQDIK